MLNKQVQIYSVDTNAFLNEDESKILKKIKGMEYTIKLLVQFTLINIIENLYNKIIIFEETKGQIKAYKDGIEQDLYITNLLYKINKNNLVKDRIEKPRYHFNSVLDLQNKLHESDNRTYIKRYVNKLIKDNKQFIKDKTFKKLMCEIDEDYIKYELVETKDKNNKTRIVNKDTGYKASIKQWKREFNELIRKNKEMRVLNKVSKYNIISVFDSFLTRTLGLQVGKLSEELITLRVCHYAIFKRLINDGFVYQDERYIPFTASAGQIRNKKMVFIKESTWENFKLALMCGLTIEDINNSKEEGCNINKFLAYLALTASATDEWEDFNIDQCIVLNDYVTTINNAKVDYISKERKSREIKIRDENGDYIKNEDGSIQTQKEKYWLLADKAEERTMNIEITHSDGCGWILPDLSNKNFQCRLPWVKGLLTSVDFIAWCDEYNSGNYKVMDIYGEKWDLKEDNIKVVFFKSQFKMHQYYKSWQDYKDKFKKYSCKAGKCNIENNKFKNSNFNYQMWQTLENVDNRIIKKFTNPTYKLITKAYTDKNTMLKLLGAMKENTNMNYLQQALLLYPELIQDKYIKNKVSEALSKKKKEAKYGKIQIHSAYYTFIIPDIFAWMQYVFLGKDKVTGLLKDGQVYCKLFDSEKYSKLLTNRSPHLGKEHCPRKNVSNCNIKKWFTSDGIYTSSYDLISKVLQFDNDGDKSLVIGDKDLVQAAEDNMKDVEGENIRPLYYEMGKAEPKIINAFNIYNSLITAFKFGNIGEYSNKLTTLWNYKKHGVEGNEIPFTKKEVKKRLNLSKIITCCNNFSIDAAKTLEMVEVSEEVQRQLDELNKIKLPYFFQFAKDKSESQVEPMNSSTVNRICKEIESIPQLDYDFDDLGKFNKHMLMNNFRIEILDEVITKYKNLKEEMQKYFMYISNQSSVIKNDEEVSKERIASVVYDSLYLEFEEFCKQKNISVIDAADMIVKYIYSTDKDCKKGFVFNVLGDIILTNIKKNIKEKSKKVKKPKRGFIICSGCSKEVLRTGNRQTMCKECANARRKENDRKRKSKK